MPVRRGSGEKFVLITEEIEICKRLSSNDIAVRNKGLSALKHLFRNIHEKKAVDVEDFKRLWNGIFNYVWMSDKPLVQEEDVESISNLIHIIKTWELALLYVKEFFNTLVYQWSRISHHRTDKFLMFVRRFMRQVLFALKNSDWNSQNVLSFSDELYSAIQILPIGLVNHLSDIYIEEVAKVSGGNIPTPALILLLKCYFDCIVNLKPSMNAINYFNSNIFSGLVRQLKLYLKQKALVAADSEETSNGEQANEFCDNGEFDPRPGRVDVYLPYIELDENMVVKHIEKLLTEPNISVKTKNILKQLISMFGSITKLRQSVENPAIILKEASERTHKRKKKNRETLAKLIKKTCSRLELEEAENDDANNKILKKFQKIRDIIRITKGGNIDTDKKKSETKVSCKRKCEIPTKETKNEERGPQTLTSNHPAWIAVPQDKLETLISEIKDDEIDYDISSLFKSPPKRRRRITMTPGFEVKRSERLANKARLLESKKVEFADKNKFQEIRDYYKTVQSSPEIPFDVSKKPFKGILKEFSIPGPINPFFYSNGKRKIGKQN